MSSPSQTIEDLVRAHLKDLDISKTTRDKIAENLAQAIMSWLNERRDSKVTHTPNAMVMTPEASKALDKKMGNPGSNIIPPTSV